MSEKLNADERDAPRLYVECRECSDCGHVGLNDASDTEDSCSHCGWSGPAPKEDKCPGCGREGAMCSACPKCGGRYVFVADGSFATPQGEEPLTEEQVYALQCSLPDGQWLDGEQSAIFEAGIRKAERHYGISTGSAL